MLKNSLHRIFDPRIYLNRYYPSSKGQITEHVELRFKWFNEVFQIIPNCDRCLEIGCGPVLTLATYASRKAKSIILSEYNVECFQPIQEWLTNPKDSTYLQSHFARVAEQQKMTQTQIQNRLRNSILTMLKCDLTKDDIFDHYVGKVDLIISSLCIEAVAQSLEDYQRMIKKLKKFLNPKGHIVIFVVLGESYYMLEDKKLPCLPLTEKEIETTLTKNGFKVVFQKSSEFKSKTNAGDCNGLLCIAAQLE